MFFLSSVGYHITHSTSVRLPAFGGSIPNSVWDVSRTVFISSRYFSLRETLEVTLDYELLNYNFKTITNFRQFKCSRQRRERIENTSNTSRYFFLRKTLEVTLNCLVRLRIFLRSNPFRQFEYPKQRLGCIENNIQSDGFGF